MSFEINSEIKTKSRGKLRTVRAVVREHRLSDRQVGSELDSQFLDGGGKLLTTQCDASKYAIDT